MTYSDQWFTIPGRDAATSAIAACYNRCFVLYLIPAVIFAIRVFFRSRLDTSLEVLALRQQIAVLKRQRPRPPLTRFDRFFWSTLQQVWPRWSDVLAIVKPETVIGWHRTGFPPLLALAITGTWRSAQGQRGDSDACSDYG